MSRTSRAALPLAWAATAALAACSGAAPGGPGAGPSLSVAVAPLTLAGVGDVVYDLEVRNGASDVVWQKRLTSSSYGDSAGSAAYVGTCDADTGVAENTVNLWVVGVYAADVAAADAGEFNAGSTAGIGAVTGSPLDFQNPSTLQPLSQVVQCQADADVAVTFDIALLRPANQGFFDIAVSFSNIFCSAKYDCCHDTTGDGCALDGSEDITLLHGVDGARTLTHVFALACTAGTNTGVDTQLYLDPIALDCTAPNDGTDFAADLRIDPSGGPGNLCTAGDLTGCAAITELNGTDADAYLVQVAAYRGSESLASGASPDANKVYWNVALGVVDPAITSCRLRTEATAHDLANTADLVDDGFIAAGAVYPYIAWDVNLGACASEAVNAPGSAVTTAYTSTADPAMGFIYYSGAAGLAGSFCSPLCENGGTCVSGVCDCSGTDFQGPTCEDPIPVAATGGVESTYVDGAVTYKVHRFTASDTLVVTYGGDIDYLVVGGGGAGGSDYNHCGGGGAGGLLEGTLTVTPQSYPIVIGAGGATRGGAGSAGGNGGASTAFGLTAAGGGGGCAGAYQAGVAGGSGGGGCALGAAGGGAVAGQGNAGGYGSTANLGGDDSSAGGGGGAGGAAGHPSGSFTNSPGAAGAAHYSAITGTLLPYAAGGYGAGRYYSDPKDGIGGATAGAIGVAPYTNPGRYDSTAGVPNTGSGGGGGRTNTVAVGVTVGKPGGSGVVIIRYPISGL